MPLRREPPELDDAPGPEESEAPETPRSFAQLAGATVARARRGRLDLTRLAAAIGVAVIILVALVILARRGWNHALAWLHARPAYRLAFDEIRLDPPPPPWIKSGSAGLLEHVRHGARRPETLSSLDIDLDELRRDFQRGSPWVRSVVRIRRAYPNTLKVAVEYRRPVALVRIGNLRLVLDRDGVVLPGDDLTLSETGPLIELRGLLPPGATAENVEALPGKSLKIVPPDGGKPTDSAVLEAARLAGDFKDRGADRGPPDAPCLVRAVQVFLYRANHYNYAITAEDAWLLWGRPEGDEPPDEPTAEQKWTMLRDWLAAGHRLADVTFPQVVMFTKDGIDVRQGNVVESNAPSSASGP